MLIHFFEKIGEEKFGGETESKNGKIGKPIV